MPGNANEYVGGHYNWTPEYVDPDKAALKDAFRSSGLLSKQKPITPMNFQQPRSNFWRNTAATGLGLGGLGAAGYAANAY
jgi:hypothetical protein